MKPGDVLEASIWLSGTETDHLKARFERDLRASLAEGAEAEGVVMGPLIMTEKKPGEDRVPTPPDGLQGPDVRLLVGEAIVFDYAPQTTEGAFVADLEPKDLERLIIILRRVYQHYNPGKPELSRERCIEYINQNGADAALEALREQVGSRVH